MHPHRASVPLAHRHPLERHQRDCERSVPSGDKRDSAYSLPHHLLRTSPLVTHPITTYGNGKEDKQNGSAAMQVLRGGQHLRVYGGNLHQRQQRTFSELYHELNKEARQDFVEFIFNEVNPQYHREIIKQML